MATWTDWESFTSPLINWHRVNLYILCFLEDGNIYALDEDTANNKTLVDTITHPDGNTKILDAELYHDYMYLLVGSTGTTRTVIKRWNPITKTEATVFDSDNWPNMPGDVTDVLLKTLSANSYALAVGGWALISGVQRAYIISSSSGLDWTESFRDTKTLYDFRDSWASSERFVFKRFAVDEYIESAPLSLATWYDYSLATSSVQIGMGKYFWLWTTGDVDQWRRTRTFALTPTEVFPDTNLGGMHDITQYAGTWWSTGAKGPATQVVVRYEDGTWENDRTTGTTIQESDLIVGYTAALFQYVESSTPTYNVWKRSPNYGGAYKTSAMGSQKISVDRDSQHVYVSTVGTLTYSPDFWRVSEDLAEVLLIEQSLVSGVRGGVHSPASGCIYCYGDVQGDLYRHSADKYATYSGYGRPPLSSGEVTEARTLYSLRDSGLPLDILVTTTFSGTDNKVYGFDWDFRTDFIFEGESSVRISGHSFVGATNPTDERIQYSDNSGYNWWERHASVPLSTVTDLEFA